MTRSKAHKISCIRNIISLSRNGLTIGFILYYFHDEVIALDTQELLQAIGQYDSNNLALCRDLLDKIIFYLKN